MKNRTTQTVYYDAGTRTLYTDEMPASPVSLSGTASAVLNVLLGAEEPVPRDALISRVWEARGVYGSYNNLNQYLSILRRAFRQCGIDNAILSEPARGISLAPGFTLIPLSCDDRYPPVLSETEPISPSVLPDENEGRSGPDAGIRGRKFLTRVCCCLAWGLFAVSLVLLPYAVTSWQGRFLSPGQLSVPECDVRVPESVYPGTDKVLSEDFASVRRALGLACRDSTPFLFSYSSRLHADGLGNTLLSRCTRRGDNPLGHCDNYYYTVWR
ncbi:winged helix-turn-helix domain-containing protein [Enterobacter cloacae subsp. cloacae]|uniref:winged helix-turn-helix domain-containing protein n=1 Tax=Enterobacter cloacae TaxID=550 RepID=UPI001C5A88E8|nr:hypothetical protein [Enterobacter cloacae]MBW4204103.1 winged helix-turn-helix domain-containing protein [Enterobacter cloacae subsp. cloacae]